MKGSAHNELSAANQNTIASGLSVEARSRTWIEISATMKAPPMAITAPCSGMCPSPGWVVTRIPAKPASTADQRHLPTFSFSSTIDRITAQIGAVKLIVVASASGSRITAAKLSTMPIVP